MNMGRGIWDGSLDELVSRYSFNENQIRNTPSIVGLS